MTLFLVPIRKAEMLSRDEMLKLFSNLETLVPVNKEMLSGLENCINSDHTIGPVGQVLKKMVFILLMGYSDDILGKFL